MHLRMLYIVVKFQPPNYNTFGDMNYFLRLFYEFSRRQTTDRKWRIWAHCANCTGGLKNYGQGPLENRHIVRHMMGMGIQVPHRACLLRATEPRPMFWYLDWISHGVSIKTYMVYLHRNVFIHGQQNNNYDFLWISYERFNIISRILFFF